VTDARFNSGGADRPRISSTEVYEVRYCAAKFDVSEQRPRNALEDVAIKPMQSNGR
jgi:hypothetical protein